LGAKCRVELFEKHGIWPEKLVVDKEGMVVQEIN
jgi:hypothetical protein